MEDLVVGDIAHDHVHQVVETTSHEVAAHDLGPLGDRHLEGVESGLVLADQRDLDEHVGAEADPCGVEECRIAVDHPRLLQASDPSQACRGREVDRIGKVDVGPPTVLLQEFQDRMINLVKIQWRCQHAPQSISTQRYCAPCQIPSRLHNRPAPPVS